MKFIIVYYKDTGKVVSITPKDEVVNQYYNDAICGCVEVETNEYPNQRKLYYIGGKLVNKN